MLVSHNSFESTYFVIFLIRLSMHDMSLRGLACHSTQEKFSLKSSVWIENVTTERRYAM